MVKWKNRSPEDQKRILREQEEIRKGKKPKLEEFSFFKKQREIAEKLEIPLWCHKCNGPTYSEKYILIDHPDQNWPIVIGHCVKCGDEARTALVPNSPMDMFNKGAIIHKLIHEGRLTDKRAKKA